MTSSEKEKAPSPAKQTPLPDVGDIVFLAMIFVTLFTLPNFVFGDGSTGWHLATGDYVLKNFHTPTHDLFSVHFSNPPTAKPWVAYEWLSDTVMAFLVQVGGLKLLAVAVCSAIAVLFLLLYERMRKEGCHFATALIVTIIGAFTSAVHWLARPHLFTFFGIYIFSTRLEDRHKGRISGVSFFAPLIIYMIIWVNSHPAFLAGIALIGMYWTCSLISAAVYEGEKRKEFLLKAKDYTIVGVGCVAASLINPYGLKLFEYIAQYFKGSDVIKATSEYMSPNFHGDFSPACLVLLYAFFVIGQAISKRRLTFPKLMVCLAFALLSLQSVRHMPLFAIVVLPAIGELFAHVWPISRERPVSEITKKAPVSSPDASNTEVAAEPTAEPAATPAPPVVIPVASWWSALVEKFKEVGEGFDENEAICQMHIVPIATIVALACVAIFAKDNPLLTSGFDPKDKPWMELQPGPDKPKGTLNYLFEHERSHDLKPEEGMNYDNYGGYLFWTAAHQKEPIEQKVFIDDRADFYGEDYYKKFAAVSQTEPGFENILKEYKINWLLFPYNSRIVATLKQNPDWQEVAHDKASTLMVRKNRL